MTKKSKNFSFYYAIAGESSNVNQGVLRVLALILGFIIVSGSLAWALS